jgi:hypothetical protein
MTKEATILSNFSHHALIEKFLRDIVKQRLTIDDYESGVLTFQLLDNHYEPDLKRLEHALELGESNCQSFEMIFDVARLPQLKEIADARILDFLLKCEQLSFWKTKVSDIFNIYTRKG